MSNQVDWLKLAQQWQQQTFQQFNQWADVYKNMPDPFGVMKGVLAGMSAAGPMGSAPGYLGNEPMLNPKQWMESVAGGAVSIPADKLAQIQQQYAQDFAQLWNQGIDQAVFKDRRFSADAWQTNPLSGYAAAIYLLNSRTLMAMADAIEGDPKQRARMRFAVQQWIDAASPSNYFVFNAEAQKKAIETQGESLTKGIQNLLGDMRQGHVSMTDESLFEVGRNVATTEGAVVFENDYFQLIEYKPLTEKVYERPFLVVPPSINKYYILDLQPKNSFVRYATEQGHRTFLVSWRNPDESMAQATWDDFVENAVIEAIHRVQDITGAPSINALGFCVGGTMLSTALSVLNARGDKTVESATLLTTLVNFTDTGVLDVFIDENMVKYREMQFAQGGLMPGRDLATTFSFLRPNDLVWNYVVGNYLKGETPPPFDLLYWNSDATNLPGPWYHWYLRNTYLENNLVKPNAITVCGEKINMQAVKTPLYLYASREDHIVPPEGAYASTQVFKGKKRFVMGASGHIAGVINPPAANKRCYWTGSDTNFPESVDEWMDKATEKPGSWWTDWMSWLSGYGGKQIAAPKGYRARNTGRANSNYDVIEAAPGRYVKAKA
ncbi:MAG: class poly(R)-hydroxyalkanoic acid synthase [Pseudomonadota bacterium]